MLKMASNIERTMKPSIAPRARIRTGSNNEVSRLTVRRARPPLPGTDVAPTGGDHPGVRLHWAALPGWLSSAVLPRLPLLYPARSLRVAEPRPPTLDGSDAGAAPGRLAALSQGRCLDPGQRVRLHGCGQGAGLRQRAAHLLTQPQRHPGAPAPARATWAPEACLPADFTATPEIHLRLLEPDGKRIYFIRCVLETSGAPGIEVLKLHVPVDAGYLAQSRNRVEHLTWRTGTRGHTGFCSR